jgi:hypothetical protein
VSLELALMMVANGRPISLAQRDELAQEAAVNPIVGELVEGAVRAGEYVLERERRDRAEIAASAATFLERIGFARADGSSVS